MALEVEQADELDGGGSNFVDKPGIYHMVVTEVDENPASKNGEPLDALKVGLQCITSTNEEQKDRAFDLMLWHPAVGEEGAMARKCQTAFCLATCLIGNHQPGVKVSVEPSDAVGRQIVCKLRWKQKKNETTGKWEDTDRVQLSFADIWHVDDNHVLKTGIMLDQGALDMIPAELRKTTQEAAPASTTGSNGKVTKAVNPVGSTQNGKAVDLADV